MKTRVGSLEVIAGPMFSGKTEELIRRIRRAIIAKKKTVLFKHHLDVRYVKRNVYSHSKISQKSKAVKTAGELLKKAINFEVVGIDETMWFDKNLISVVSKLVDQGKRVIVTGLALTYTREPFSPMPELMALADKVDKLTSVCNICGREAIFHKKIAGPEKNPFQIVAGNVGKTDVYEARCRRCFDL